MSTLKKIKRDMVARIKHPIWAIKFDIVSIILSYEAAMIKAMWDNYRFEEAVERAKKNQQNIDKMVDILIGLYDSDYFHVRVEINPNIKYGLGLYVNN